MPSLGHTSAAGKVVRRPRRRPKDKSSFSNTTNWAQSGGALSVTSNKIRMQNSSRSATITNDSCITDPGATYKWEIVIDALTLNGGTLALTIFPNLKGGASYLGATNITHTGVLSGTFTATATIMKIKLDFIGDGQDCQISSLKLIET